MDLEALNQETKWALTVPCAVELASNIRQRNQVPALKPRVEHCLLLIFKSTR